MEPSLKGSWELPAVSLRECTAILYPGLSSSKIGFQGHVFGLEWGLNPRVAVPTVRFCSFKRKPKRQLPQIGFFEPFYRMGFRWFQLSLLKLPFAKYVPWKKDNICPVGIDSLKTKRGRIEHIIKQMEENTGD